MQYRITVDAELRDAPNRSARVVARLPAGTVVDRVGKRDRRWMSVRHEETLGWIADQLIEKSANRRRMGVNPRRRMRSSRLSGRQLAHSASQRKICFVLAAAIEPRSSRGQPGWTVLRVVSVPALDLGEHTIRRPRHLRSGRQCPCGGLDVAAGQADGVGVPVTATPCLRGRVMVRNIAPGDHDQRTIAGAKLSSSRPTLPVLVPVP